MPKSTKKEPDSKRKVLFIGFDCASWKVLDPLLKQHELPNLSYLIKSGVSCITQAFDPPISPVLWTSIATAKLPDKHGIKDFLATSKSVKCKRLWDILEQHGYTIGLFGHFLTWPPQRVNGFNIPILFAQKPETYPAHFNFIPKMVLTEKKGGAQNPFLYTKFMFKSLWYGVRPITLLKAGSKFLSQRSGIQDHRKIVFSSRTIKEEILSDIFIHLHARYRPQYAFFHCHIADSISHNFWCYYEPEKFSDVSIEDIEKFKNMIPEAYRKVDRIIGRLLRHLDSETLMIVASDHGAKANISLRRKKFYLLRSSQLIEALGLEKEVNVVNLNLGALMRLKHSASQTKDMIVESIKNVSVEGTKERVFDIQTKGSDSIYIELNPELIDVENANILISKNTFPLKKFVRASSDRMSGTHDIEDAVLIMAGKNLKKGVKLKGISILDIIPTLLTWLNLPAARDMDGRVIQEAFEDSYFIKCPIQYIDSYDSKEEQPDEFEEGEMTEKIREELRSLGYLD